MEIEKYKGKFIRVTEEEIAGQVWERSYVPDGVIIYPVTDEGKILFVEEKRPHETPNVRLKAVTGIYESDKGSPEENAQREMQEEIGLKARELSHLMTIKASGTISNTQYFYVARGLVPSKLPNPDGEDSIIGVKAYSPQELIDLLMSDQIRWSMSALGLFRLIEEMKRRA
jgi:8-oxo-dGTP pyrophosphatase MutT (NUDIX family)